MKNATFKDEAEENAVRGAAYFQRAYRYYKLTHLFGDVPYLSQEIETPKVDFYTYDRWSILEQMEKIWSSLISGYRRRSIEENLPNGLVVYC